VNYFNLVLFEVCTH